MEQESWHRELGDVGSLAARPAGGDAPAGAEGRGARRLRSLSSQLPRSGRRLDGGGGRPTREAGALPKSLGEAQLGLRLRGDRFRRELCTLG